MTFNTLLSLDDLFSSWFYNWDDKIKPPATKAVVSKDEGLSYSDAKLQFALAGFKLEDLNVYVERNVLYIEGSNLHRDNVMKKFKSSFKHEIPVSRDLDLSKLSVSFEDGLLTVLIPVANRSEERTYFLKAEDLKKLT
jgi:HSP20 family molecular chaperone IbpA